MLSMHCWLCRHVECNNYRVIIKVSTQVSKQSIGDQIMYSRVRIPVGSSWEGYTWDLKSNLSCSDPRMSLVSGMWNICWGRPVCLELVEPIQVRHHIDATSKSHRQFSPSYLELNFPPPCIQDARHEPTGFNNWPPGFQSSFGLLLLLFLLFLFWNGNAIVYYNYLIFLLILQRLTGKNLTWVLEEILNLDFWTVLVLLRLWRLLEMNIMHFAECIM